MARHAKAKSPRGRPAPSKTTKKTFLIFCEGEKTEPNYFRAFRKGARVEEFMVFGTGKNTKSLVQEAANLMDKYTEYDEVWCVFDKDSFTSEQFNTAIQKARAKNIKVAYSNEAFELWYLLHFRYSDTPSSRTSYKKELSKYLGTEYQKNDLNMYGTLLSLQSIAIRNAKKLEQNHVSNSPAEHNPVTLVYQLVESLNKLE